MPRAHRADNSGMLVRTMAGKPPKTLVKSSRQMRDDAVHPEHMAPMRRAFAAEYLKDLSKTHAAIRAGYSPRTANSQATHLMRDPRVAALIKAAMDLRSRRVLITQDRVLQELEHVAFSDISHYTITPAGDVVLTPEAPPGAMKAISALKKRRNPKTGQWDEVEIRLWDKPNPLRLAGKHVGLFQDRLEVSGPGGGPIVVSAEQAKLLSDEQLAKLMEHLEGAKQIIDVPKLGDGR